MQVDELWLIDFRSYREAHVEFAPGLTVVRGPNGRGKTNLLEAIGYLATLRSFRGAPPDALVHDGCSSAVIRARARREDRALLLEAEIQPRGRSRALINRQPLKRHRDLLGALQTTVFLPDDLVLVKGGPAERRTFLDDTLVALHPRNDVLRTEVERVLRQRNALLKQAHGRISGDVRSTLDVWNQKLVDAGEQWAARRVELIELLSPYLCESYDAVAREPSDVVASYVSSWRAEGLAAALRAAEVDELRRGVSLVGPHRDDLDLSLGGLPGRTHASQGEQRSLALALRLAAHRLVTAATGSAPVLLLDDIFSELDPGRSAALLEHLPGGQTILTTASAVPPGSAPELVLEVTPGRVSPE